MRTGQLFLRVCVWSLLVMGISFAQVTTGTLMGTVSDSTGAVIPGATVTIRNVDTGSSRTITTDAAGKYRAPQLGLGAYEITAESAGFQTEVRSGVTLTVGREATVDFTLNVGAVAERITVTGEAPMIETTNATVSSLVDQKAMRDLPLNGRNFADLTAIQPGVVTNISIGVSVFTGGPRMAINGARPQQSTYLLDGIDIIAPYENVTPASVLGQSLGVDTIREFTVLQNNFGAQYGRAAGGVVNAVTRSGTNEFHGGAFEFLRNKVLDARQFFDRKRIISGVIQENDPRLPPYVRNQFGATMGGPIKKDSTFFFLSYEGLRQRNGITDVGRVPTKETRAGNISSATTPITGITTPLAGGVNPVSKLFLDLLPLPNGEYLAGGTANTYGSHVENGTEDYGMVRIDQKLSDNDNLFGRFTIDNSKETSPLEIVGLPDAQRFTEGGYRFAAVEWTRVLSPTLLNTVRVGFTRNNVFQDPVQSDNLANLDVRMHLGPDKRYRWNGISVSGITALNGWTAPGTTAEINFIDNVYEYTDTINYTVGRHNLVVGANFRRYQMNELTAVWNHGAIQFTNVTTFLQGKPNLATITTPDKSVPGSFEADVYRGWRQTYGSGFIQDDFQLRSNLSVNLGLRWEKVTAPVEVNGKATTIKDLYREDYTRLDKGKPLFLLTDSLKGIAPRIGVAWSPSARTSIRSGVGIFKEIPLEYLYQLVMFVPPWAERIVPQNPQWPYPLLSPGATAEPTIIDYNFKIPYTMQWNLGIEQQLTGTLVVKASYLGTRGILLAAQHNPNQPATITLADGHQFTPLPNNPTPNSRFTSIRTMSNIADSYYHAMQVSVEKRFSQGIQFNTSYTWSKNIDSNSIGAKCAEAVGGLFITYNSRDLHSERAVSTLHAAHNFRFNSSYELPLGNGKAFGSNWGPVANAILGGWQINGIFSARPGLPFSAFMSFDNSRSRASVIRDRPDLAPGKDNNPVKRDPNKWFDTAAFEVPCAKTQPVVDGKTGCFGNLPRNTMSQDKLISLDFSVFKGFSLGESRSLQFRAEFFNLANHTVFGLPNGTTFTNTGGSVSGSSGQVTGVNVKPRQIQFGLKLEF